MEISPVNRFQINLQAFISRYPQSIMSYLLILDTDRDNPGRMKNKSYFSLNKNLNPLIFIDRWLNPYTIIKTCDLDGRDIKIALTRRAQHALAQLSQCLIVEMQLYFSCMVKKRIIFHNETDSLASTPVNKQLSIAFHCVQSDSCDPLEFAMHFPGKRTLDSTAALKIRPRTLHIDYKNSQWLGDFSI
jgi:hypothetical protein